MDTRRREHRPGQTRPGMQQGTAPGHGTAAGHGTAPVEIVELQSVGPPGRGGFSPSALVAAASVAILAVAAIAGAIKPPNAEPSPSAAAIAVASASAAASTSPSVRPSGAPPTPGRPTIAPTPRPTAIPWAWKPSPLGLEGDVYPEALWAVDDRYVLLVGTQSREAFATSSSGGGWEMNFASPAIGSYQAGVVIDNELWFAAHVWEVNAVHLELVHTKTGAQWDSLGPADVKAPDWMGILERIDNVWVMSVGHYEPESEEGAGHEELRFSDDGRHWIEADPDDLTQLRYYQVGRLGKQLVVIADKGDAASETYALVTNDGQRWESAPFPKTPESGIFDLACGPDSCVAVGTGMRAGLSVPMAWSTTDGLHWTQAEDLTGSPDTSYAQSVVATQSGYLAIGGERGDAWLSADGSSWRHVQVAPPGESGGMYMLGVLGDQILAIGDSGAGPTRWIGSLAAMGQ